MKFIAIATLALAAGVSLAQGASLTAAAKRKSVPELVLPDAAGQTVRLSAQRGHVVLLNFWATWCGPCREEMPALASLVSGYQERGLDVLGVSLDSSWEPVRPFLARTPLPYPVLLGNPSATQPFGKLNELPVTYLIDRQQRIAAVRTGATSRKQFQSLVEALLQEN